MASKDYCLPDKPNIGKAEKDQYSNLNLNQKHECSDISSLRSKSVANDNKKLEVFNLDDSIKRQDSISWYKSIKHSSSSDLNINRNVEENDEFQKEKSINNSTLSLHIAAYENAFEVPNIYSSDIEIKTLIDERVKSGLNKALDPAKQLFICTSPIIQNPFEFPRQQSDKTSDPEIMQFKATQNLLNPNARISRLDISKFYHSLTPEQKKFFDKYQEEHDQIEKDLVKTQMLLHEEKKEKLHNAYKSKAVTVQKGTEDETTKKLSVNIDVVIPYGAVLSNEMYCALIKQIPQRSQRRKKILQIFGLSNLENDFTVLSKNFIYKFDEKFEQSRKAAIKKGTLIEFNKETVLFPRDKLPISNEKHSFQNSPITVTKEATIVDSEMPDESDYRNMPSLEAIPMDTVEPLPKKSRFDTELINLKLTVHSTTQTDLGIKQMLELDETKKKFKNLNKKINYHKMKSSDLKESNKDYGSLVDDLENVCDELDEEVEQIELLRDENAKLKQDIRERDGIIMDLNDQLSNRLQSNKFFLKDKSGKFTVPAHTCFSRLISQGNVAQDKVPIVILVVADLFNISIDAVPSRWTVGRDIHMVQSLNCEFIAKFVKECSNLTFLSDETTKFTKKLQAFVISGNNNKTHQPFVLHLGVSEVPTKSAERCLQEFKQVLSNIGKLSGLNAEKFVDEIVVSIRNLMGDQAATTKLLYKLFIEYRSYCLETFDYDDVTKASLERVNIFFCMLHILSNTSDIVFKAVLDHEKFCTNNDDATEAIVLWVITEVARHFSKRSSGRYSTAAYWEALAKEMELKFFKIDSYHGHRFVIRYKIASEIAYNREEIIGCLEYLGNTDTTLEKLKEALKNEMVVLHLHVLGLFGAVIFFPMWELCAASSSVLQMSLYAPALTNYLKELVDDPMLLFTGTSPFDAFPAVAPKEKSKAAAFLKSLKEREIPSGASEVVPIVAKSLLEYFERQLEQFITGIYSSPDISLERETAGAPLTNMPCESAFGYIDRLFTTKPNMTTYNRSALMLAAGKLQEIHRENIEKSEKLALKQQSEKNHKEAKRKQIAVELRECGFWLTTDEMDEALRNIPPTTAIKYVKSNIRYRKAVWSPKFEPKNLLQFQYRKHKYTDDELVANLKA
uniref:Uncharacterized protein n=1 Tax=Panagrolaimus sp. ES5 TaxID=591445 RepID=A0AC34FV13_9BILA